MSEEAIALVVITRHITLVQAYLSRFLSVLQQRMVEHDLSKLSSDEFNGFVKINRAAREHKYGSAEYRASLKKADATKLHYSRNSHHPEYHENGIEDMSFFDIIEMVIDWKAASITYGQSSFEESLEINKDRFSLTKEQLYLIRLIAKELGE